MRRFASAALVIATLCCVVTLLTATARAADAARGAELYGACASCHMVGKDARNRVGPHLNELFGRRAASIEGFNYSKDIARAGVNGLIWTPETLDAYIENPQSLVSGTRMRFRGLDDPKDRKDVIAFLRQYSANPRDIPEAAPTAERDPLVPASVLAIQGDLGYGEYLSGECVTCHQSSGADQGIPSITGWPQDVFVTAMHAYRGKARSHPVMQMIAGPLSDEEIAALAAYFESLQ